MHKQIQMLRIRMSQHERDRLSINYNKVPKNITYLTKTEVELKKELVQCIETCEEMIESQENEFKRLRREHLGNLDAIDRLESWQMNIKEEISKVLSKQTQNDEGMAILFKISKIN